MCGISGLIHKTPFAHSKEIIHQMNNRIIHRGPDSEGIFEVNNVCLGHRRLSIIDLTESANQPMQKHGFSLVFNGEIYNYIELRQELIDLGYSFHTTSDTEVILSAYHCFGKDCVKRFNGMWAFLLLDPEKESLVVSRDQFGIKPLYVVETSQFVGFASEIKQFLEIPDFTPKLNRKVTAKFLIDGSLNQQQETFFETVHELKPGTNLIFNFKTLERKHQTWYRFNDKINHEQKLSYEEAVHHFNELFEDAVKIRMRSDVRVGSCLSGGIDSSAIVCKVNDLGEKLETVTSCYTDTNYDEQQFSDIVSSVTGFKSNKIYGDDPKLNRINILEKMIYHQDQPVGGGSHNSEFNVFSEARKNGFVVMLDGQGSDEYLGGYPEFKSFQFQRLFLRCRFISLVKLIKEESNLCIISKSSILERELKSMLYFPLIKQIKKIIDKQHNEYSNEIRKAYKESKIIVKSFSELSILELEKTSLPYQLHSEDRNSMLFSIESRLPFLDYRLIEFCLSLPDTYKYRGGYTKKILRDAVQSLPKQIKERKDKMGFVSPDEQWVKENKEVFQEALLKAKNKFGFVSDLFLKHFNLFIEGKRNYEPKYFRVLSLVYFCEVFEVK